MDSSSLLVSCLRFRKFMTLDYPLLLALVITMGDPKRMFVLSSYVYVIFRLVTCT